MNIHNNTEYREHSISLFQHTKHNNAAFIECTSIMCSRQWISRDINLSVVDSSYHNLICVCTCVCSPPITRGRYLVGTKLPSVTDNGGSLKPTYIEDPAVYMCKKESVMLNFHPLSLTHQYTPSTKVYNPVLMPFCLHCCNPTSS